MNKIILLFALFLFMPRIVLFAQDEQVSLPEFSFQDLESNAFTQEQLKPGLATIALFFDPYCEHCAQQAEWIQSEAAKFAEVQFLWVTTESLEPTLEFKKKYFPDTQISNNHFLLDTDFMFDSYFGYSEVPSIYVFNSKGQRVASFKEVSSPDIILQNLK